MKYLGPLRQIIRPITSLYLAMRARIMNCPIMPAPPASEHQAVIFCIDNFTQKCGPYIETGKTLEIWAVLHGFASLKRHNVGQMLPNIDWDAMIMDSVERLIAPQLGAAH